MAWFGFSFAAYVGFQPAVAGPFATLACPVALPCSVIAQHTPPGGRLVWLWVLCMTGRWVWWAHRSKRRCAVPAVGA